MSEQPIFIHIPKTGGTTINTAMHESYWQTTPDFHYRHILADRTSNSGDIFDSTNAEQYRQHKLFMMLRHPIDRLTSEYYFIKDRGEFIRLLGGMPADFAGYVRHPRTANAVVNFLKGHRMYPEQPVGESDLADVLKAIDELPIHVGIFEHFAASLSHFAQAMGLKWKKDLEVKRMTLKRPKVDELSEDLKALIIAHNPLDMALYTHALARFEAILPTLPEADLTFHADRYNHVVPYCAKWCFFDFCMRDKRYIAQNFPFFKGLTFYLLNQLKIRDGRVFTRTWNRSFLNAVKQHFPETKFNRVLQRAYDDAGDPLTQLEAIAAALDAFMVKRKVKAKRFYTPMVFKPQLVVRG